MDALRLTPEQAAETDRLFQILRPAVEAELRQLTQLLASRPEGSS